MKSNKMYKKNFYSILEERKQLKQKQTMETDKQMQFQLEEEQRLIQKHQLELQSLNQ